MSGYLVERAGEEGGKLSRHTGDCVGQKWCSFVAVGDCDHLLHQLPQPLLGHVQQ